MTRMMGDVEGMEDGGCNLQRMWQKAQTGFKGQVELNVMAGMRGSAAGFIDIPIYVKYHCISARLTICLCRQA